MGRRDKRKKVKRATERAAKVRVPLAPSPYADRRVTVTGCSAGVAE